MLPHNLLVADHLDAIAYYEELFKIENYQWRASAYVVAVGLFKGLNYEVLTEAEAKSYKGIGPKISKRVEQFSRTGTSTKLQKLRARDPVRDHCVTLLSSIETVTIVQANQLYELGICTLEQLRASTDLITQDQALFLEWKDKLDRVIPRGEIHTIESMIREVIPGDVRAIAVGSYRRGEDTKEVDILLTYLGEPVSMISILRNMTLIMLHPIRLTDISFRGITWNHRIINLRLFPEVCYPHAAIHLTGSNLFRVETRLAAERLGLYLNEYVLRDEVEQVVVTSERELFYALRTNYISPGDRGSKRWR